MALIPFSRAIGALKDSDTAGGTNYYIGAVVNITDLSDVNVDLFSDRDGTIQLPQNGVSNVTDAKGNFECFIAAGSYKIKALGEEEEFDLKDGNSNAVLSLTLAEAIANTGATTNKTFIRITDLNNGLFAYKEGLTVTGHKVRQAVPPQVLEYVDSNKKASHLGFDSTPAFDNAQAFTDLLSLGDIDLDLDGVFESTQISSTVNSLNIRNGIGFELKSIDSADTDQFVTINTNEVSASISLDKFKINADGKCAKGLTVTNTVKGESFKCNVDVENATQTASTGLAAGIYLNGGFSEVVFNNPVISEILSTGGSMVSSGIRAGQNGSSVSDRIIINNPVITGVRPGNDGDGIVLLQAFPFTASGVYEVNDGDFTNCHKRAIKTQCFKTIVRNPYIRRTEVHTVFGGNTDIDPQYGNATVINPTFDYSTGATAPVNGLISLMGERGAQTDNEGQGVTVLGGVATVRDDATTLDKLFQTSSFDALDKINRCTVKGFKFNGKARVIHNIRPIASVTFNDNVTFNPSFEDCYFQDVSTSFFELDRSGTGYAFVKDASVINCTIESGLTPLSTDVTTQVGITFILTENNTNIGDGSGNFIFTNDVIAGATPLTKTFSTGTLSSVYVTASFASSSGNTHHTSRVSLMQYGDDSGEDQEINISNDSGSGGNITITSTLVSGEWEISVVKAAGLGGSGRLNIMLQSSQLVKPI